MEVVERFWAKVDFGDEGDCWHWDAACTSRGYGAFHPTKGETVLAHRWVYEHEVGPIPEEMTIDHECHNGTDCPGGKACEHRRCVNPAHLAVKSNGRNLADSHTHNSRKTHCPHNHPYSEKNTYITRRGTRVCIECRREYDRTQRPERRR